MVSVFNALAGRPGSLFVDTGSNEGTWSVIAASYGMRVLAVDPQQLCLDLLVHRGHVSWGLPWRRITSPHTWRCT